MEINKSELFKRAWRAFRKYDDMTFSDALRWSWKIEKNRYDFREWRPAGNSKIVRRYFKDNSYLHYKWDRYEQYFELYEASGGLAAEAEQRNPIYFGWVA